MRFFCALVMLATCASCGPAPVKNMSIHDQRQQILNRIADKCGLPRATFELIGDDELHMKPEPTTSYPSVDCALNEIKKSGISFNLGFVGNEAYFGNVH